MKRIASLLALAAAGLGATAPAATATPGSSHTAVVSIGDSYISGEAGRWANNSTTPDTAADNSNSGTDRACMGSPICTENQSAVYVDGTAADTCHRSDVAEVLTSGIPVSRRINIACSGAKTNNLYRASSGGQGQNGEQAQGDLLANVAGANDVKLIIVSIGGNDLGFAGIVADCLQAYTAKTGPCHDRAKATVESKKPAARRGLIKDVNEIRAVMASRGYKRSDYRLVFQTYPSVMPRAAEARYAESDSRRSSDGCPLYDKDLNGARDELAPEIGQLVKDTVQPMGAEILELKDLLQGHEICSKSDGNATPVSRPDAAHSEWGRALSPSAITQGQTQEVFHPNAHAQRALGTCLGGVYAAGRPGTFNCTAGAGRTPASSSLRRLSTYPTSLSPGITRPAAKPSLRLHARVIHPRRHRRSACFRFFVTAHHRALPNARVRYIGKLGHTNRRGRVEMCARHVKAGRHKVVAGKKGYRYTRIFVRTRHH